MSELNSTAQSVAHKAFDAALDKTSDTLRPMLDQVMAGLHDAVERINEVASEAVAKVEYSGECIKDAQTRMTGGARGYVRAQPLTAVGIAVASGFLLSWALRQR